MRSEGHERYLKDASHFTGHAEQVLFPSTENEIAQILQEAQRTKTPITVSGAGTGLTGARVPLGGILLCTDKLNRILRVEESAGQDPRAVVQPAVTLQQLEEALKPKGLFYPPDPGEMSAFLGGTVATNASGPRSFAYGATRKFVERLRIVLPTGELLEIRRGHDKEEKGFLAIEFSNGTKVSVPIPTYPMPCVKNAAGYYSEKGMDLADLFIGSEGTLGVFTEIELKVLARPERIFAGILFFDLEKGALEFALRIRDAARVKGQTAGKIKARAVEFFDARSLALLSSKYSAIPKQAKAALFLEEECAKDEEEGTRKRWLASLDRCEALVPDPWLSFEESRQILFREFRHDLPVLVNERARANGFRKIGTDVAVPDPQAESMFDSYREVLGTSEIDFCVFGHIGDNHLHANFLPKTQGEFDRAQALYEVLARKAVTLGGTISAEHGIGKVRIPYLELMVGKEGLKEMARVKRVLDPAGILNPGNIFPSELLKEV